MPRFPSFQTGTTGQSLGYRQGERDETQQRKDRTLRLALGLADIVGNVGLGSFDIVSGAQTRGQEAQARLAETRNEADRFERSYDIDRERLQIERDQAANERTPYQKAVGELTMAQAENLSTGLSPNEIDRYRQEAFTSGAVPEALKRREALAQALAASEGGQSSGYRFTPGQPLAQFPPGFSAENLRNLTGTDKLDLLLELGAQAEEPNRAMTELGLIDLLESAGGDRIDEVSDFGIEQPIDLDALRAQAEQEVGGQYSQLEGMSGEFGGFPSIGRSEMQGRDIEAAIQAAVKAKEAEKQQRLMQIMEILTRTGRRQPEPGTVGSFTMTPEERTRRQQLGAVERIFDRAR